MELTLVPDGRKEQTGEMLLNMEFSRMLHEDCNKVLDWILESELHGIKESTCLEITGAIYRRLKYAHIMEKKMIAIKYVYLIQLGLTEKLYLSPRNIYSQSKYLCYFFE